MISFDILKPVLAELIDADFSILSVDQASKISAQYASIEYQVALHWYIKLDWDSTHKIPFPRNMQKMYRSKGEVMVAFFHLVERVFSGISVIESHRYECLIRNPAEWFSALIYEEIERNLLHWNPRPVYYRDRPKDSLAASQRRWIKELAKLIDPVALLPPEQEQTRLFYESCYRLASFDQFRKKFWSPYIASLRADLRFKQNSGEFAYGTIDHERDQLIVNLGKGRGKSVKKLLWEVDQKNNCWKPYYRRTSGFIT